MKKLAYATIVVGTDLSELGHVAIHAAAEAARQLRAERLHLVHVRSIAPIISAPLLGGGLANLGFEERIQREANLHLSNIEIPGAEARVTREVCSGPPARELARVAEALHA